MGVVDLRFPEIHGYGSRPAIGHNNRVIRGDSKGETRQSTWPVALQRDIYSSRKPTQSPAEAAALINLHRALRGRGFGCRFRNPTDWTTEPDNVSEPSLASPARSPTLQQPNGVRRVFDLNKQYFDQRTQQLTNRRITRPIPAGNSRAVFIVYINGVPVWQDGTYLVPGLNVVVAVDYDGGRVYAELFSQPIAAGVSLECQFTFDQPVRPRDDGLTMVWDTPSGTTIRDYPLVQMVHDVNGGPELRPPGGVKVVDLASAPPPFDVSPFDAGVIEVINGSPGATIRLTDNGQDAGGPVTRIRNSSGESLTITDTVGTPISVVPDGILSLYFWTGLAWTLV